MIKKFNEFDNKYFNREELISALSDRFDIDELESMSDEDLKNIYFSDHTDSKIPSGSGGFFPKQGVDKGINYSGSSGRSGLIWTGENIKKFESFLDDTLSKADPSKPIVHNDLVGKPYNNRNVPNLDVVYAVEFVSMKTFDAYYKTESYLEDMGYIVGDMQRNNPIGFSDEFRIPKWDKMSSEEQSQLDGVIISDDFREGNVTILWFKAPKY